MTYRNLIFEIKGNSLDDGPGIRSVIFFKGCNLNCIWCHNPESKNLFPELTYESDKCISCLSCKKVCLENSITYKEKISIDRMKCNKCFRCTKACPAKALKQVGKEIQIEEIIEKILPYKDFFDNSNGGVTISGGEATLHMDFLFLLLKRLKDFKIHVLLETNGYFDLDKFNKLILPYLDVIFFDIKFIDPIKHKKYCKADNREILENFIYLYKEKLCEIYPRTPLIPKITDTQVNIENIVSFYKKQRVKKAYLLPNNPSWFYKLENLDEQNIYINDEMKSLYPMHRFDEIKYQFVKEGIEILL